MSALYKEIEVERVKLLAEYGSEAVIRESGFADWVVYVLTSLSKAGNCAGKPAFREHMLRAAALTILAIEATDRRLKEHD